MFSEKTDQPDHGLFCSVGAGVSEKNPTNPTNPTTNAETEIFDGENFLSVLNSCGISLQAHGGKIRFDAPAGKFTPELRAAVAEHRDELLKLLASDDHGAGGDPQPRPSDVAGPQNLQALPGCGPVGKQAHGADGPQDDHGDAGQAHGDARGADGPQDLQPVMVPRTWPAAVPDLILAAPIPTCSDCGRPRSAVPGQPGRPAGLCFDCWISRNGKAGTHDQR